MMAADYRHIGGRENRLGRHYSRFSPFWPTPALSGQSLALRKLCDAGSNRRSQANTRRGSGPIAPSGVTIDTETPSCVIGDRTGTISGIADLRTGNKTPPKFGGVLT